MTPPKAGAAAESGVSDDALVDAAQRVLAATLDSSRSHRPLAGVTLIDALVECAAAVGTVVSPARIAQARRSAAAASRDASAGPTVAGLGDPSQVARRLDITLRRVKLEDGWWRGDSGPYLVGRRDGSYAAVVPRPRGYDLVVGGAATKLTAAMAVGVEQEAWSVVPALPPEPSSLNRLLSRSLGAGSRSELGVSALSAALLTVLGLAGPLAAGVVVGELVPLDSVSRIIVLGLVLVLVAVASFGFATIQSLLIQRLTLRVDVRATAMVLLRLTRLPLSFFRRYSAGDLQQRLQGLDEVAGQVASAIVTLGSMLLLSLSGVAVMVIVSPTLAGLVVGVLLVLSLAAGIAVWAVVRARTAFVEASLALSGQTLPLFEGIAKIRVSGAERRLLARWVLAYAERQRAANRAAVGGQRLGVIATLAPTLVTFVVVVGSATSATPPELGSFTSFVAAAGQTAGSVAGMWVPISVLLGMAPLLSAVRPILTEPLEQRPDAVDPGLLSGEIDVVGVSFAYGADDNEVLHEVSLRVTPGEFVAVVGPSGSGKSTLVRLLIGLAQPTAGEILYDGRPLDRLDADALRRQIGVVSQSAQLATGTLLENIVGASTRTEDEAWEAARLAGIADDIAAMPMGMRTLVSDGASTFSGGQKQRVLLARALVRTPRIVILDEATSTLDNRTQDTVVSSLRNLGATRIVIAHRLSTIADADRIVVLDAGRVVESGTYDELAAADGLFAQLVQRQVM